MTTREAEPLDGIGLQFWAASTDATLACLLHWCKWEDEKNPQMTLFANGILGPIIEKALSPASDVHINVGGALCAAHRRVNTSLLALE